MSAGGYHPSMPEAPERATARSQPADQPGGGSGDASSDGSITGRQLTPSFATLQFDQSPGEAVLAVRVQQPNVVAEVCLQRSLAMARGLSCRTRLGKLWRPSALTGCGATGLAIPPRASKSATSGRSSLAAEALPQRSSMAFAVSALPTHLCLVVYKSMLVVCAYITRTQDIWYQSLQAQIDVTTLFFICDEGVPIVVPIAWGVVGSNRWALSWQWPSLWFRHCLWRASPPSPSEAMTSCSRVPSCAPPSLNPSLDLASQQARSVLLLERSCSEVCPSSPSTRCA